MQLNAEGWDRLVTWIDLNVPDHGIWHEHRRGHSPWELRRRETRAKYAGRFEDPEEIVLTSATISHVAPVKPTPRPAGSVRQVDCPTWPFDQDEAKRRQADAGEPMLPIPLPDGNQLQMMLVPAGEFVMGAAGTGPDEYAPHRQRIDEPFYMAKYEITNAQYALFDPAHDSAYISMTNKAHGHRGHPVNQPTQPVVRVTWQQVMAFCRWLSGQTGRRFNLPTEAQWEWACRAGSGAPSSYGDMSTDFSKFANLADLALTNFAQRDSPKWHPKDDRFDDHAMVTTSVGRYRANAWGLFDMHGNAAEWTQMAYQPSPLDERNGPLGEGTMVVRGGSWYDRPHRARSSSRMHYERWQPVYNVGFRVMMELER